MLFTILILLPMVRSTKTNPFEQVTTLAIKHEFQERDNAIPVGISNFTELVLKSKMFLDNSLICEEIKKTVRFPILISCPSQWGKSTILTMLKAFLEIQVDEQGTELRKESTFNYKLFVKGEIVRDDNRVEKLQRPLLIAHRKDFVAIHQGKFPVIFVTLKEVVGFNYENIEWKLALAISEAFAQHQYIIQVLQKKMNTSQANSSARHDTEKQLDRFNQHFIQGHNMEVGQTDQYILITSLAFLSELLETHFHVKTCVLIDDYDAPMQSFFKYDKFPADDIYRVSSLIEAFLTASTTGNPHYGHGIIMGTFHIQFYNWESYAFREIFNSKKDKSLSEFFGFKQPHVEYLFTTRNITSNLANEIRRWYNYQDDTAKRNAYNPTSIVDFLSDRKIDGYRSAAKYENFIPKMLKLFSNLRNEVLYLISKRAISVVNKSDQMFEWVYKFAIEEVAPGIKSNNTEIREEASLKLFYGILLAEKYLIEKSQPEMYVLPNDEIACLMANWMISFYKKKYQIRDVFLDHAADALHRLVKSEQLCPLLFKGSLTILVENIFAHINQSVFNQSETITAQEILNCVVLRMQRKSKFEMDAQYNIAKTTDIIIYDHEKRQGAIIELFNNCTTAADLTNKHTEVVKRYSDIHKILSIRVSTCSNKITDVAANSFEI